MKRIFQGVFGTKVVHRVGVVLARKQKLPQYVEPAAGTSDRDSARDGCLDGLEHRRSLPAADVLCLVASRNPQCFRTCDGVEDERIEAERSVAQAVRARVPIAAPGEPREKGSDRLAN